MSPTGPHLRDQWALKGALARLNEINEEMKEIYAAFPELRSGKTAKTQGIVMVRGRRKMSADARKRMSEGMRKYWQRRKNAAKKAS